MKNKAILGITAVSGLCRVMGLGVAARGLLKALSEGTSAARRRLVKACQVVSGDEGM